MVSFKKEVPFTYENGANEKMVQKSHTQYLVEAKIISTALNSLGKESLV